MVKKELRKVTLGLPVRPDQVLLGMKKRGFGAGKFNGFGGKQEPGETIEECLVREVKGESGLRPIKYHLAAVIDFLFPDKPVEANWEQQVYIYLITGWEGEPINDSDEDEMGPPIWFKIEDIPYNRMWKDDPLWLPRVLAGERLQGYFAFAGEGEGESIRSYELSPLTRA